MEEDDICETSGHSWVDSDRGHYCQICGKVEIVSDNFERTVEFVDLGGGIGEKQGTYVSHDIPSYGIRGQESRRKRIITVKGLIQELVSQIGGMSDLMSDKAYRIFKLADRSNFVRGRKTQLVIASCIYIACRIEETPLPYMLIDFSDAIQTNVFDLGRIYLKMRRILCHEEADPIWRKLRIVDPSFFIERFSELMEFGDKIDQVRDTANRLVKRMKRDWIITGRHPSGVCGAALLIAARLHGFKRTQIEISRIVHVCDMTLRKRLEEFGETASSQLTHEEFKMIDFEDIDTSDPPSFVRGRELEEAPPKTLIKVPLRKKAKHAEDSATQDSSQSFEDYGTEHLEEIQRALKESGTIDFENLEALERLASLDDETLNRRIRELGLTKLQTIGTKRPREGEDTDEDERDHGSDTDGTDQSDQEEEREEPLGLAERQLINKIKSYKSDPNSVDPFAIDEALAGDLDNTDITEEEFLSAQTKFSSDEPGETFELSSDDEDIMQYIITDPDELNDRIRIWEEMNQEYEEQQRLRMEKNALLAARVKRKKVRRHEYRRMLTAAESIDQELQRKGYSRKINYTVQDIGSIFD